MDRFRAMIGGFMSIGGAVASSLCCLLPLTIVLLELASAAFMATTMKYTALFIPVGVASVSAGFYLHFRESCAIRSAVPLQGVIPEAPPHPPCNTAIMHPHFPCGEFRFARH